MMSSEIAACWISRGLSEKSKERAVSVLNETKERKPKALAELRQLLNAYADKHPDLAFPRRDDAFLVMFLRARLYDVQDTMKLLKRHAKYRAKNRDQFEGVTFESIRVVLETKVLMPLPLRDAFGRRVIIERAAASQPELYSSAELLAAWVYVLDALIQDEESQVNGFLVLSDYGGMTMSMLMEYDNQETVDQTIELFHCGFPVQFHAYHIINQPWYFPIAWESAKPLAQSSDVKERLHIHGRDLSSLYNAIPRESLPAEVGGEGPPYDLPGLLEFLSKVVVERPSEPQHKQLKVPNDRQ